MKNVITYADGLAVGLAFCADGMSMPTTFFGYVDACLARRPCADGLRGCADGSGPSAPWLAAVVAVDAGHLVVGNGSILATLVMRP
jgi:hypothetical protein